MKLSILDLKIWLRRKLNIFLTRRACGIFKSSDKSVIDCAKFWLILLLSSNFVLYIWAIVFDELFSCNRNWVRIDRLVLLSNNKNVSLLLSRICSLLKKNKIRFFSFFVFDQTNLDWTCTILSLHVISIIVDESWIVWLIIVQASVHCWRINALICKYSELYDWKNIEWCIIWFSYFKN